MHHLIYNLIEFSAVLGFFAVPPVFREYSPELLPSVSYRLSALFLYAAAGAYLVYASRRIKQERPAHTALPGTIARAAAALLLLCLSSALWQTVAGFSGFPPVNAGIMPPQHRYGWILFTAGTVICACFEEIVYRLYLPGQCAVCAGMVQHADCRPVHLHIPEIIPAVLFALAHRYLGVWAMLNALCAAAILRMLFKKTGFFFLPCAVHSVYNFIQFAGLFQTYYAQFN